jgi:hypothetical protein
MNAIKSCEFNMDTACVDIVYYSGGTLSIYTPMIEKSLQTTACSRSKLDWLIENAPLEYAEMALDGMMQTYLDMIDDTGQDQLRNYTDRLAERFPRSIAEDIAREMMMYS